MAPWRGTAPPGPRSRGYYPGQQARRAFVLLTATQPRGVLHTTAPVPDPTAHAQDSNEESRIATFKAKWSHKYRQAHGIENCIAANLPKDLLDRLGEVAVRTYQAAGLRDYGRIDVRLAHDQEIYIVEANPNPYLADGEDLAWAAEEGGERYPRLIQKVAEMAATRKKTDRR
jgi:hypothetical protein